MNNLLTIEEVKSFLDLEEAALEKYLKQGRLKAYKIGGTYLRFRKDEVLSLRSDLHGRHAKAQASSSLVSKAQEFWRFNNFYIISLFVVVALAYLIVRL